MAASTTLTLIALLISLISFTPFISSSKDTSSINGSGFKTRLIHLHSPRSPLYNPNFTACDRIQESVSRSLSRQHYLSNFNTVEASPHGFKSPAKSMVGEYLMRYYIGTPPTETFAIFDTGSQLSWLQCEPCLQCYNRSIPIFDPTKSSTYKTVNCTGDECNSLPISGCDPDKDICKYLMGYADNSYSEGDLSFETLMFENTDTNDNYTLLSMPFGCGHHNKVKQYEEPAPPGIFGVNRGPLTLVSQIFLLGLSHCFASKKEMNFDSTIYFGLAAKFDGERTPMVDTDSYFYYLSLEGISVDGEMLPISPGTFNATKEGKGGFIIDSGTTLTMLVPEVFKMLIKEVTNKSELKRAEDSTKTLELCYDATMSEMEQLAPEIMFHFTGADLLLSALNTWTYNGHGLLCLAMLPANSGQSILGNYQQQNVNVGYNLDDKFVSFQLTDCTAM